MITIQGYYENDRVQLLEPVPAAVKIGTRSRVVVLFLDIYDATADGIGHRLVDWSNDVDSREQAALLKTIREELAPYMVRAMKATEAEDWGVILG